MAAYDLEEQEQIEELKTWWKMYGNLVTGIVVVVALVVIGWQGWVRWQANQSAQAAQIYSGVEQAAAKRDSKQARQLAGELIEKFPRTAYAAMGALISARLQIEADDAKNAKSQLQWVAESANDDSLRELGRLRYAALLIDDKAYDEALKQLATPGTSAFAPRFNDLRGDVYALQNKLDEARKAYQAAITALEAQIKDDVSGQRAGYLGLLKLKLEGVGGTVAEDKKDAAK